MVCGLRLARAVVLAAAVALGGAPCGRAARPAARRPGARVELAVLGDSVSDTGSTFFQTHGAWPVVALYPQHAFSDSSAWPALVGAAAAGRRARVNVQSLALGGATVLPSVQGFTGPAGTWPVAGGQSQLEMFEGSPAGAPGPSWTSVRKVISHTWAGNDIFFQLQSRGPEYVSSPAFLSAYVDGVTALVRQSVQLALSNNCTSCDVVLATQYPLELTPWASMFVPTLNVTGAIDEQLRAAFVENIAPLATQQVRVHLFELRRLVLELAAANASPSSPCIVGTAVCADPSRFVFYDLFHLTSAVHERLAEAFADMLFGR
jgi:hypothetical protein